ncbi:MAG: hypothetical protein RLZZ455_321 [Candidatus Parcubacteria bacterium]
MVSTQTEKQIVTPQASPTPDPQEAVLLDTPLQDASEAEKKKHFQKVIEYAKEAEYLDVSGCKGKPVVLFVTNERPVKIVNNDKSAHTLSLNKNARYTIPAKSSEEYLLTFAEGPGVYGFGCDALGTTAGLFVVRP